jgi:hypothetical protein
MNFSTVSGHEFSGKFSGRSSLSSIPILLRPPPTTSSRSSCTTASRGSSSQPAVSAPGLQQQYPSHLTNQADALYQVTVCAHPPFAHTSGARHAHAASSTTHASRTHDTQALTHARTHEGRHMLLNLQHKPHTHTHTHTHTRVNTHIHIDTHKRIDTHTHTDTDAHLLIQAYYTPHFTNTTLREV